RAVVCALLFFFFFQAEDGIRDRTAGVQTCALPICGQRFLARAASSTIAWRSSADRSGRGLRDQGSLTTTASGYSRKAVWISSRRSEERRVGKESRARWGEYQ